MSGMIFDIKEMAVHDGPGVRTTVFFKGCPLRCRWCHNPEGLKQEAQLLYKDKNCLHCGKCQEPCEHEECKKFGRCVHVCPEHCLEITGRKVEAACLRAELLATAEVLGEQFGGFTFSGGEPLAQPEFLFDLARELKGYHLCIETSGYADNEIFRDMVSVMDYIIMDIKFADAKEHRKYTGVNNEKILENFRILQHSGKPYVVRTPLIAGITDTKENLEGIKRIIGESNWEQLPQNQMAGAKYKMLGMEYEI